MPSGFETPIATEKIKHEEIEELREPLRIILTELREQFDHSGYTFIIGDDASGRIPALIIGGIAQSVAEEKKLQPPQTLFFAGSRLLVNEEEKEQKIQTITSHLSKRLKEQKKDTKRMQKAPHVLIVTEYIDTGRGLIPLTKALRRAGIGFDVTSIVIGNAAENLRSTLGMRKNEKFIYGSHGLTPDIYSNEKASGVTKHPSDVYARRLSARAGHRGKMREIRKDAVLLGKQLLEYYRTGPKTIEGIYAEQQALRRLIISDTRVLECTPFDLYQEIQKQGKESFLRKWVATQKLRQKNDAYKKLLLFADQTEKEINSKLLVAGM